MKRQKSIGIRILLGIVAVVLGLGVQVLGALVDKLAYIGISPQYSFGLLGLLFALFGFAVMGFLIYKWSIK